MSGRRLDPKVKVLRAWARHLGQRLAQTGPEAFALTDRDGTVLLADVPLSEAEAHLVENRAELGLEMAKLLIVSGSPPPLDHWRDLARQQLTADVRRAEVQR